MPKESKDGKSKTHKQEPQAEVASETAAENGSSPTKARPAIDDVIAAIESARDKVMADEVKALTKLGIPRAMAYQMVAARFHQNVVTDGEERFVKFQRVYDASAHLARVALTPDREIAQLWQSAPDPLTGWRRLRSRIGCSSRSQPRSCCGPAGRSSSAAGHR